MIALLRRLNDLPIFDPSRWPAREWLARIAGSTVAVVFIVQRLLQLPDFPGIIREVHWARDGYAKALAFLPKSMLSSPFDLDLYYGHYGYSREQIRILWSTRLLVWLVETGILVGYIIAFLIRDRARSVAKGFLQTVYPIIVAGLPVLIMKTSYTYHLLIPQHPRTHIWGLCGINLVLIAAGSVNLLGLYTLRKAFTLMSEARTLIRAGLYRVIRHPLYAAHFVIYFCYTLLHFHLATAVLYVVFVAGQTFRARTEERKLAGVFPEYEEYRRTTGMFFPRLFRRRAPEPPPR